MFDVQIQAGIRNVVVKVKAKDGVTRRRVRITLEREFDATIAAGLGGDARAALLALETGGMESCVLPMDAIDADAQLTADLGESIEIRHLRGVKATGKCAVLTEDQDMPPSIKLEFEFAYERKAWIFFGDHSGATATLLLKKSQLELAGAVPTGKKRTGVSA